MSVLDKLRGGDLRPIGRSNKIVADIEDAFRMIKQLPERLRVKYKLLFHFKFLIADFGFQIAGLKTFIYFFIAVRSSKNSITYFISCVFFLDISLVFCKYLSTTYHT